MTKLELIDKKINDILDRHQKGTQERSILLALNGHFIQLLKDACLPRKGPATAQALKEFLGQHKDLPIYADMRESYLAFTDSFVDYVISIRAKVNDRLQAEGFGDSYNSTLIPVEGIHA